MVSHYKNPHTHISLSLPNNHHISHFFPNYPLSLSTMVLSKDTTAKRSLKRKLEPEFEDRSEDDRKVFASEPRDASDRDLVPDILAQISVLNSALSSSEADRAAAKSAAASIAELAKNGTVFVKSDWCRVFISMCMRNAVFVCVCVLWLD